MGSSNYANWVNDKKSKSVCYVCHDVLFYFPPPSLSACILVYRVSRRVPQLSETQYLGCAWICHYLGIRILTHTQPWPILVLWINQVSDNTLTYHGLLIYDGAEYINKDTSRHQRPCCLSSFLLQWVLHMYSTFLQLFWRVWTKAPFYR